MAKRTSLSSNYAVAYAVKMADVDVIAAYPITPQTHIVEKLSEFIANGELNAEMIHVESEHSAMSATIGASAAGARVFTATASQGLELMHEILHIASGMRLPIVMAVASRALSPPINIWSDYSDIMNARDTGWIIYIVSSAQEAFDTIIQAYKLAENKEVLLPVMVAFDGFVLSHTFEAVDLPEEEEVRKFIPKQVTWYTLDPENPMTLGPLGPPEWYYEFKYQQVVALNKALEIARQVDDEYGKIFGRKYGLVEPYRLDDAEIAIVAYGALASTAKAAIDEARKNGIKVGLLRLRLFRPSPVEEIAKYLENVKAVGVMDRAISFGAPYGGPVFADIMEALYMKEVDALLSSFILGIGGRPMYLHDVLTVINKVKEIAESGRRTIETYYIGVRE